MTERTTTDLDVLAEVQQRVLWLAVRIVDAANRRPKDEVKVGGHQASSASMTSIMTSLWFDHISGADKVAVKPHASPVYHAIKYLTGELDRSWLTTLRQRGGLQAYPSRTKDPDVTDFSTGSVGLGAVAPLFSALTRRYIDSRADVGPSARFIATVGDAELDEGNVWEAIADSATAGLGNFTMVVDLNRQSLDRVIPGITATRMMRFFANAGWHVAEAKYGNRLTAAFADEGGDALRAHIDGLSNEAYQALFALSGEAVRKAFLGGGADAAVRRVADGHDDEGLKALVTDLGGHDLAVLRQELRACDDAADRPSVLFAYTVKGWGLPMAGDPLNHAALLSEAQIDQMRKEVGLTVETEWDRFDPDSPAGQLCARVGAEVNNAPPAPRPDLPIPVSSRPATTKGNVSTQEAFGRVLTSLADVEGVADRLVTTAPDVSISTNLGGFINKLGVYAPTEVDTHGGADRLLRWAPGPTGQHIELGISEMNLFMLLGQLGLAHDHHGHHLLPIGTVYDPFVLRGLDALVYGVYNASRFIVIGTPAGVTLAPEGGAHQSTITPSVGLELPNLHYAEPAFATELDWLLCDALRALGAEDGESTYLRLSTRQLDQAPFAAALSRVGAEALRHDVLAGGFRLVDAPVDDRPGVTLVTTGVMAVEALAAAAELEHEGIATTVLQLSSPDRLYRSWRGSTVVGEGRTMRTTSHLDTLVPLAERSRPLLSVQDGASHALAWMGSALGIRQHTLGVDRFGESGTIADLHDAVGISADHIVTAAIAML